MMIHANIVVVAALIATVTALTVARVHFARRAGNEDAYQRWIRQTQRMLVEAERDPRAYERRGFFLGPSVVVGEQDQRFARRAVDEGELAWAHGRQFVKLSWSPGFPPIDGGHGTSQT